ncbi:MAG: glycosyl hydrolase 2 galactose-binding domain-containing protein, partial [Acidobacteriota bacterium]
MKRLIPTGLVLYGLLLFFYDSAVVAQTVDKIPGTRVRQWSITLEEPTGIFRRDGEIVSVVAVFARGEAKEGELTILTPHGRELMPQIVSRTRHTDGSLESAEILFPASIIPGERPVYRLIGRRAHQSPPGNTAPELGGRAIGVGRYEISNRYYSVIINLGLEKTAPGIVAAWHKRAGEGRMLNLIDTSPDVAETLDYGVKNGGVGTFIVGPGPTGQPHHPGRIEKVEIVEPGPYRLRIRMTREGERREIWEFTSIAGSPVLTWRTRVEKAATGERHGFFFSSLSAAPYEPFNRVFDGEETRFPDGWETDNPPDRPVGPQNFTNLPGGHFLYYNRQEDYGALGIFELDSTLDWKGIGARQFHAVKELKGVEGAEIGLSFPRWKGTVTIVEARGEYRQFTQPILAVITPDPQSTELSFGGNAHQDELPELTKISKVDPRQLPEEAGKTLKVDLSGKWRAAWAEKAEGERQGYHLAKFDDRSWREVDVPGSAHLQFLDPARVHSREAEWVSAKEWWYRRQMIRPVTAPGERIWLHFEATDYYAEVYLNDRLIGRHEGYIDPWSIEVTDLLLADRSNTLAVRVWTPVSYYWRHRPYTIKGSYGAVDQKPDKITPTGITRPANLTVTGPATIDEVAIDTRLNRDGSAEVIVDLTRESTS